MDIYIIFLLSSVLAISNVLFSNAYAQPVPPDIILDKAIRGTPLGMEKAITAEPTQPLAQSKELALPILTQDLELGEAKKYQFKLKKITFTGNTVIDSSELIKDYQPYYGKVITLAELMDLIKQTTRIYRERGYILSQAYLPAQDIDKINGTVEIGIVEGYINEVVLVSDSIPYSTKILLKQYGERMVAERPITKRTLERYSLLTSDVPGGSIKIVFSPAKNKPGAANIEFVAEKHKVVGAELYYNNRGTRLLGPEEYTTTLHQYNGIYGNRTSVSAVRTDQKDMRLYAINHKQPLNSDGLALTVIATRTRTQPNYNALPEFIRTALQTPGSSDTILGQLEYPLIRSRDYNFLLQAKLDGANNETDFLGETLFKEKLRTFRAGFIYDWLDSWALDVLSVSLIGVEFSQGIHGLGSYLRDPYRTRPDTKQNYSKVSATFSRTQPLSQNFYLRLLGVGQYAFNELVSAEEFGFGGRIMGLGYDPFQVSGDHGIAGKAELGYRVPMGELMHSITEQFHLEHDSFIYSLLHFSPELFGFYDGGRIWNINNEISGQKKHDSAVSAGFGIRGNLFKYIVFEGYMAKPMTRIAENELDRKPRYFFSIGMSYH
jgi:hemolysin activation/secretion protein